MKITIFKNIFDTTDPLHIDVVEILKRIKDGNSEEIINNIRTLTDKDEKNNIKKRLPSICFSGRFSKRDAAYLLEHSGLICLDIDDVNIKDLQKIKDQICDDIHVFACFVSPSGYGLKVLIKIHPDKAEHKSQFLALEKYFNEFLSDFISTKLNWNEKTKKKIKSDQGEFLLVHIDPSGKDVNRVCYESFDADLFYNEDSERWIECLDEEIEQRDVQDADLIIIKLQKWIDGKESYFKGNRNQFLYQFSSALCRYGISINHCISYLAQNYSDYPFNELQTTIKGAYKANDFASQTFTQNELRSKITHVQGERDKEVTAFWSINDRGKVIIDPKQFLTFISANGFAIYRHKAGGRIWEFVRVENMIVDIVDVIDIKTHILKYVEKHAPEPVFTELQMRNRYFEKTFLNALPILDVEQIKDDAESSFMFFENYYFQIFADRTEKHDYIDLQGRHIWRSQMCRKNITEIVDYVDHDFNKFVFNATGQKTDSYVNACSALGYLLHTYKKRRLTKLVYACDGSSGELDGMANGGTGKNLFFDSLKYVRSLVEIDGKDFDKRDKFKFQTVTDDTQIVNIDDYEGDIKELFTRVTGHFEIEKKGLDKVIREFEDAPKMMVSSNTSPSGFSSSFNRRLHLIEFSDHYNEMHTPADEFGDRDFFSDDWTQDDFNAFYSFMMDCVMIYLKQGLKRTENSAGNKFKQAVKNTGRDFAEHIAGMTFNDWEIGRTVFEKYVQTTGDSMTLAAFYSKMRKVCAIYGWELETEGSGLMKKIKINKA